MENNYNHLKEKAYKIALKFKGSKLEQGIIYAKLEKQGFPENIAKEVAFNISLNESEQNKKRNLNYKKLGFIILAVWFLIATVAFVITGNALNAFWILFYGIGATFLIHAMTTNE
ncbi:hypothetical protein [Polaribacter sp.]|uniref:hypothetical protein n=1 Tax=Polaribacter sp. TaxID=1920175 RepID=UPI003F6C88D6